MGCGTWRARAPVTAPPVGVAAGVSVTRGAAPAWGLEAPRPRRRGPDPERCVGGEAVGSAGDEGHLPAADVTDPGAKLRSGGNPGALTTSGVGELKSSGRRQHLPPWLQHPSPRARRERGCRGGADG